MIAVQHKHRIWLCSLGFLSWAASSDDAAAAPIQAGCADVAPAERLTFNHDAGSATAKSAGPYGTQGCAAFVVEVLVTSDSRADGGNPEFVFQDGGMSLPLVRGDEARCKSLVIVSEYYTKLHGQAAYTKVGGGTRRGEWHDKQCSVKADPDFKAPPAFQPPSPGLADFYRVATTYKEAAPHNYTIAGLVHLPRSTLAKH
jgi:hypothetical protein